MAYVICENCGEYYELEEGESLEDYICECGWKLKYIESPEKLHLDNPEQFKYNICQNCGFENDYNATNCSECSYKLMNKNHDNIFSKIGNIFNFKDKKTRYILIMSILAIFAIFSIITGIMSIAYPDTSAHTGYLAYTYVKINQFNKIEDNQSNTLDSYLNNGISDEEAIRDLKDNKQKLDGIINDLENIKVPAKDKSFHDTLISALKDFSAAIGNEITAVQNHDPNSVNNAISLTKSASSKLKQAEAELK